MLIHTSYFWFILLHIKFTQYTFLLPKIIHKKREKFIILMGRIDPITEGFGNKYTREKTTQIYINRQPKLRNEYMGRRIQSSCWLVHVYRLLVLDEHDLWLWAIGGGRREEVVGGLRWRRLGGRTRFDGCWPTVVVRPCGVILPSFEPSVE